MRSRSQSNSGGRRDHLPPMRVHVRCPPRRPSRPLPLPRSGLGARMNRLLTNCGRGAVAKKLGELNERYGIEIHQVQPAYDDLFGLRLCRCPATIGRREIPLPPLRQEVACGRERRPGHRESDDRTAGGSRDGQGGTDVPLTLERHRPPEEDVRKAPSSPRTRSFTLRDLVRRFDESMTDRRSVSRPRRGKSGARESAPEPKADQPTGSATRRF